MTYAKITQGRKRRVTVSISPAIVDALDGVSADSLASRSTLVEQAISQWIVRQQNTRKRRVAVKPSD